MDMSMSRLRRLELARDAVYTLSDERNNLLDRLERLAAGCIVAPVRSRVILFDAEQARAVIDKIEIATAQLLRAVEEYNRLNDGPFSEERKVRIDGIKKDT